ncbi:hypothetical protein AVEN_167334-1 [Araneus ventricosus]|uniref:Uncharacterized protein n=1 Tax=Araneus ventricosus TaxID=182803 RepID=A0A4Y2DBU0_ARAVE|nr:hypothetical protein AVEN_167334-1 [Araneus ventricosus]
MGNKACYLMDITSPAHISSVGVTSVFGNVDNTIPRPEDNRPQKNREPTYSSGAFSSTYSWCSSWEGIVKIVDMYLKFFSIKFHAYPTTWLRVRGYAVVLMHQILDGIRLQEDCLFFRVHANVIPQECSELD